MTANLESSAVATEPEKSGFIPVPKKNNDKIVQITAQLHSFHMPARLCSKSFKVDMLHGKLVELGYTGVGQFFGIALGS